MRLVDLQNDIFKTAQSAAKKQGNDYRGLYSAYIGELESIINELASRDRAVEVEARHMLQGTLARFKRMEMVD